MENWIYGKQANGVTIPLELTKVELIEKLFDLEFEQDLSEIRIESFDLQKQTPVTIIIYRDGTHKAKIG